MPGETVEERFWSKVDIGEEDECWEWLGYQGPKSYGMFRYAGRATQAHRVAWTLTYGEIPKGMHCCHHCDNPSCCNPYHLFIGTNNDNMQDKIRKGRQLRGELVAGAILTEPDVLEIRGLLAETSPTYREIGRLYGVGPGAIGHIQRNERWEHVQ